MNLPRPPVEKQDNESITSSEGSDSNDSDLFSEDPYSESGRRYSNEDDRAAQNHTQENLNTSVPMTTDAHLHQEDGTTNRNQITVEEIQFWRQYRNIRRKYVSRQIKNFLEYYITGFSSIAVFFITKMIIMDDEYNISFICGLNVWCIFYFSKIIRFIRMYPTILEAKKKLHMRKSMAQIFCFICSIIQISLYSIFSNRDNKNLLNVYFITLPFIFSYVLNFLWHIESANSCFYFLKCIKLSIGLFRIVFVFMVFLKLDKKITLSWNSALWPVWFAMVGLAMLLLFVITLIIFTIQQVMDGKSSKDEFFGLSWIFYMVSGGFGITIYLFIRAISVLDGGSKTNRNYFLEVLTPPVLYSLITVLIYFIIRNKLPVWFEYFLFYEEMVIEMDILANEEEVCKPPDLEVYSFEKETFMKKRTGTYFSLASKEEFIKRKQHKAKQKQQNLPPITIKNAPTTGELLSFRVFKHRKTNTTGFSPEHNFLSQMSSFHSGANSPIPRTTLKKITSITSFGSILKRQNRQPNTDRGSLSFHERIRRHFSMSGNFQNQFGSGKKKTVEKYNGFEDERSLSISVESTPGECLICFTNRPNAIMWKCGHGGCCYECGICILKESRVCHLCREKIAAVVKIDLENMDHEFVKAQEATFIKSKDPQFSITHLFEIKKQKPPQKPKGNTGRKKGNSHKKPRYEDVKSPPVHQFQSPFRIHEELVAIPEDSSIQEISINKTRAMEEIKIPIDECYSSKETLPQIKESLDVETRISATGKKDSRRNPPRHSRALSEQTGVERIALENMFYDDESVDMELPNVNISRFESPSIQLDESANP